MIENFANKLVQLTSKKFFLIAYSGGMDSHVLLHNLVKMREQDSAIKLRAVHIHHGLSSNADSWVDHCQNICQQLQVSLIVRHVDARPAVNNKHSPEALARELRYQVLSELLQDDEVLLVAQHADDQAETILLQLFRGAGVAGLAAMPEIKPFAASLMLRPLLQYSREQLHQYAVANNLYWIEDESNENIGIDRNYVRHKLMPTIKQRWHGILTTLGRSGKNCAAATKILEQAAVNDIEKLQGSRRNTLSIKKLKELALERQNNVIRYWLASLNFPLPDAIKLQHIHTDVLNARMDSQPLLSWPSVEIRRYRDDLYAITPLAVNDTELVIAWDGKSNLILPNDLGVVTTDIFAKHKIKFNSERNYSIRFRHKSKGAKLKKVFQQHAVPPWERGQMPLLYVDDEFLLLLEIV